MSTPVTTAGRIDFLDEVRALAMITIYLLHTLERFYNVGLQSTLPVWQVICAVSVPLFFFVSGMLARRDTMPIGELLPIRIKRSFMPVIFFSVLMLPGWILQGKTASELLSMAGMYLYGLPYFQWVTWFLIAKFWIELMSIGIFAVFGSKHSLSWLWCALFILAGGVITPALVDFAPKIGLPHAFWFIAESFVGAAFYFAGHAAKPLLIALPRTLWVGPLGIAFLAATFCAAPRIDVPLFRVVISPLSLHGNYSWFVLTAFLGIIASLLLTRMLPTNIRPLQFIGRHSLFFMGLNGFCFHFLDIKFATAVHAMPDSIYLTLPAALTYVALVFAVFTPLTILLKRYCSPLLGLAR